MKLLRLYLIVGALLLGGLLMSAFYAPIWYDDAGHFLVAREVARGHGMCYPLDSSGDVCLADSPFITMGPVQAYPMGWWMRVWGETMLSGRLFMLLLSLGAAVAFFRLGKALTSTAKALIAVGLVAVNIQFITYGAEVLGEVPMIGLMLGGLVFLVRWERGGAVWNVGFALLMWCLAVGIKEYAILPTGLSLIIWLLIRLMARQKPIKILMLGIFYILALALTLTLLHGTDVRTYLQARQSYGSEFLAFNWGLSLKFLLLKPLFWLGTGAMVLKWRVKRRGADALILSVQLGWLCFFLLSAGYDRFGFLLLFLPAIYVAEFVPYLWREAGRKRNWAWARRSASVMVGLAIFSQQTYWVFGKRVLHPETVNAVERAAVAMAVQARMPRVFTMEQQMAVFLDRVGKPWRLVHIVPSAAAGQKPLPEFNLASSEVLLAGPYALTEYHDCIDWSRLTLCDSIVDGNERWYYFGAGYPCASRP
jgi:4-amino-4-deoxy-L-arabinose transferase-like glycosyltransferase